MTCAAKAWRVLICNIKELRLDITLACGQSFRWKETSPGEWTSVLHGRIWTLKQDTEAVYYKVTEPGDTSSHDAISDPKTSISSRKRHRNTLKVTNTLKQDSEDNTYDAILRDYFQLQYNLVDLYSKWSKADDNFREAASTFSGVRMLRQDPVENLFSFICSSNNHISRISGMVERMCESYGELLGEAGGLEYYSFPTVQKLAGEGVEQKLRDLGFGYRAKFISQSARTIAEHGDGWLVGLRGLPYEEAKAQLQTLPGVGAKVADCVCLMSLDHLGAIPVDTHVWQIAARHYISKLNTAKSLTPTIYNQIGDHFRSLWGDLAGWAHSVMFSADLKKFKDLKTVKKGITDEKMTPKAPATLTKPEVKLEESKVSPRKRQKKTTKAKTVKRTKR